MKFKDLKIASQLRVGLGAILVLVMVLGAVAWYQTDTLWQETQGLYDHPHAVRRALGELEVEILLMHQDMDDLSSAKSDAERQSLLQDIDSREQNAYRQFDILRDRYLGPVDDVNAARNEFVRWRAIRDETVRLLRAGETAEVTRRNGAAGIEGAQTRVLLRLTGKISDFARARGDRFFADALAMREALRLRLAVVLGAILLLAAGFSYLLWRGIREPIDELGLVAEQFRTGRRDARSRYVSANEFGVLSSAFNELAETLQADLVLKENTARIAQVMLQEEELQAFCRQLVQALMDHTGSQVGAVYLLNEQKTEFEHFESIGLKSTRRASYSAQGLEGEFGAALNTREIQRVSGIPADTRLAFSTVSGDLLPRELLTIPIESSGEVIAVISLASVHSYTEQSVRTVTDLWRVMTARLNGVLAIRRVHALAERLEGQNRELEEQKRELSAQAGELGEQNIELELQKKSLDQASRLKSAFLSNMSHELRTPLNSVIALSGVLSRRLRGTVPEEEYSYLEVIERNGKNLLALINDVLDLARIESGREEIGLSRFSVRDLAAEVVAMLEPQAREKNVALFNRVPGELPPLRSDLAKCRHILQNIVGNAVKFTAEGAVDISAVQVDEVIELKVADTGIGIAADQVDCIFDEFRQADESTTRSYGGTGLGLSIARKYARLLRGSITVASTPGKGSTFTITLPLAMDSARGSARPPVTEAYVTPEPLAATDCLAEGDGKCILVVEDSAPAVVQLTDILVESGYRVKVARNGREALEQIRETLPCAVILDLMMPEVDGFEVLRAIRGEEKSAHLPVLILTAKHVTRDELSFLTGNGIHQLIQKGDINRADLLAAVGEMVSPHRGPLPASRKVARTPGVGSPAVLVVEDNPDNLTTIRALLADTCKVIVAVDGKEALAQARAHRPDLILMDISLPDADGFQALERLRSEESLCDIPVVAMTARAMKGDREEILARGFDGYLSKPIDKKLLEDTILEGLHGRP